MDETAPLENGHDANAPVDFTKIKAHKPHWLQVWKGVVWTDEMVCSTCGLTKKFEKAGEHTFDPHSLLPGAEHA